MQSMASAQRQVRFNGGMIDVTDEDCDKQAGNIRTMSSMRPEIGFRVVSFAELSMFRRGSA